MTTVREALVAHYRAREFDADPACSPTWTCRIGRMSIEFPNWKWRRRAIMRHDLHHIVTGYPCTMVGEMQMAAWEFAAGRFRHWAATLFCLPLALTGLIVAPRKTVNAFHMGLKSKSLYGSDVDLNMPLAVLESEISRAG